MDLALLAQHALNGAMLGVIYALVAVGFTLFFGVLDVIKFSHGDVVMLGAFTGLATSIGLSSAFGSVPPWIAVIVITLTAVAAMALVGALMAKFLVLPLHKAPTLNVLLITLMAGTVIRESVRLFYPQGSNPKPFPRLLPDGAVNLGRLTLRFDSAILLAIGVIAIVGVHLLITRTRLGLAIRAVAQDPETASAMGIPFQATVLATFALGSGLAALAGVVNGLYYSEVNFSMGLLLGAIGFSAAVIGGLGNVYGAILGGFIFAALQTIGAVALPIASAYKDVFAFGAVIALMAWKPAGLLAERSAERV
ncbi:MAG: branched-chain amino acid ABC transporter permease [Betaproteobacteria bacterium]|nr:branched-chain amino acid ABC transporter permease [Betaproteobacteria bacterium]